MTKIFSPLAITLYLFAFGSFLRFYNLSFDDLWIDEMSTFWIANPNFDLSTSIKNHVSLELTPFVFNFLIKNYFLIFGYSAELSRIVPALCSILAIVVLFLISKEISQKKEFLLTTFLVSLNIFLISYSQELRVYSTLFLLISLSILFFIRTHKNQKKIDLFYFFITTLISAFLHHYAFILLISYIFFFVIKFNSLNKIHFSQALMTFFIFVLSCVYYYKSFTTSIATPTWMLQPDLKFYTNFYFSKFFGSRIVGLFFLILLCGLLFKRLKLVLSNNYLLLLGILLVFSYAIPLIYGYISRPVIMPRYIIFVLIPIILLISHLTFDLNKQSRNIIFALVVVVTIGNLFTEETFKQFYKERVYYKPEITKALSIVNKSDINIIVSSVNPREKELIEPWKSSINNYLNYLIEKNNFEIFIKKNSEHSGKVWILCVHDLNQNNCKLPLNTIKISEHTLNRLNLILMNYKK